MSVLCDRTDPKTILVKLTVTDSAAHYLLIDGPTVTDVLVANPQPNWITTLRNPQVSTRLSGRNLFGNLVANFPGKNM